MKTFEKNSLAVHVKAGTFFLLCLHRFVPKMIYTQLFAHGHKNHNQGNEEHLFTRCACNWPTFGGDYYDI